MTDGDFGVTACLGAPVPSGRVNLFSGAEEDAAGDDAAAVAGVVDLLAVAILALTTAEYVGLLR